MYDDHQAREIDILIISVERTLLKSSLLMIWIMETIIVNHGDLVGQ